MNEVVTRLEALDRASVLYGHTSDSIFVFAEQIYEYVNKGAIPPGSSGNDNPGKD